MSKTSYLLAEDPAADLAVAEAMAAELEEYIVKDELYRTVIARTPAGDQKISMAGGDLLARLYRLEGERAALLPEQVRRLDDLQQRVDATIYSLKSRFHARLQREIKARLDSLRWFLDECREDRQRCRTNYPFEMRHRQRIEEILKRVEHELPDDLRLRLNEVDRGIRLHANQSEFVWDERLRPLFPAERYWYLYIRP